MSITARAARSCFSLQALQEKVREKHRGSRGGAAGSRHGFHGQEMAFIENLLRDMTLEEKIGQLTMGNRRRPPFEQSER